MLHFKTHTKARSEHMKHTHTHTRMKLTHTHIWLGWLDAGFYSFEFVCVLGYLLLFDCMFCVCFGTRAHACVRVHVRVRVCACV